MDAAVGAIDAFDILSNTGPKSGPALGYTIDDTSLAAQELCDNVRQSSPIGVDEDDEDGGCTSSHIRYVASH